MNVKSIIPIIALLSLAMYVTSCSADNEFIPSNDTPVEAIRSEMIFITDSTQDIMEHDYDKTWWEFYNDENGIQHRVVNMPMKEATCSEEELIKEIESSVLPYKSIARATKPILTTNLINFGSYWEVGIKYCRLAVTYQTKDLYSFPNTKYGRYRTRYELLPNEIPVETIYLPKQSSLKVLVRLHDINANTDISTVSYSVGFEVEIVDNEYVLVWHRGIDYLGVD